MPDVASWGWYVTTPWPGYSIFTSNNLDGIGNGLVIDTSMYVDVILRDLNGDGIIYDDDSFDGSRTDAGEAIIGPTLTLIPEEVALYVNSTLTIYGVTYTDVSLQVTLLMTVAIRSASWIAISPPDIGATSLTCNWGRGMASNIVVSRWPPWMTRLCALTPVRRYGREKGTFGLTDWSVATRS